MAVAGEVAGGEYRREVLPNASHDDAVVHEATRAVAAIEPQRAVRRAGEQVRLAVAVEVARREQRGEVLPADAGLLAVPGQPAAGAVAAVQQQPAVRSSREQIRHAIAAEVARRQQRREALPARADRLRPAG